MSDHDPQAAAYLDGVAREVAAEAKAKRRKRASPTELTVAECRKRGWHVQNVERPPTRYNPRRIDLFGVIDLIAIVPPSVGIDACQAARLDPCAPASGGILGIQATTGGGGGHRCDRRDKILAEPRARAWVDAGGRLELWTWRQPGGRGQRWVLRVETYAEMVAATRGYTMP